MWHRYPDTGWKALVFLMWRWRAESRNSWAMVEGEEDGSSLPPTLCLSRIWECSNDTGALRTAPGIVRTEREKAQVMSSAVTRSCCGTLQTSYRCIWGEEIGKKSSALTDMVVLGSKELDDRKRRWGERKKIVWGWEMAGTLICRTSDCAAGLRPQPLYNTDSEEKTAGQCGDRICCRGYLHCMLFYKYQQ